jgi:hypothetical protein
VTALPGRILRTGLTFLQDGTGGIAVQLPDGTDESRIRLGTILRVTGRLADPYANLELRPDHGSDVMVAGEGGLPAADTLLSTELAESVEGTLARASGVISRVEAGSGSIAVTLRDDAGEMRVFVFGSLGLSRDTFPVGASMRVTGIVGQRESSSGAGDGYRLWPRDRSDVSVTVASATARPGTPTARPGSTPRPTDRPRVTSSPEPPLVRIAAAEDGATVTVQGTVTSRVGLFDSDERRLTLQDGSGAILVRLPEGTAAPRVGTRLRVRGVVGTWFATRQLEADAAPRSVGQGSTAPTVLRRAPVEADEWRLVRVTVRITKVTRDGDAWRAEASLGAAGTLPIVGVARSGVAADVLEEGRNATVTGIVKRAHPSATDQRFGIAPRDARDVRLGPAPRGTRDAAAGGSDDAASDDPTSSDGDTHDAALPTTSVDGPAVGTSIKGAQGLMGRRVRVAGALRAIDTSLLTLDDGSARGLVRLLDTAPRFDPPLSLGEVVNVTGTVATRDVGGWEIVATTEGVLRASRLTLALPAPSVLDAASGDPSPSASAAGGGAATEAAPPANARPANDLGRLLFALLVGLGIAALVVLVGVLGSRAARRRRVMHGSEAGSDGAPARTSPLDAP